jgi:site-specific DNA-methyltransferase (adenine-specific)
MLKDNRLSQIADFPVASDVFPGVKVNGGICYFLWEKDRKGLCKVTTTMKGFEDMSERKLDQFDTFVRFNQAIPILEKILAKNYGSLSGQVSRQKPFGLRTFSRPTGKGGITLYANNSVGKIQKEEITNGQDIINSWKVITSMGYGEGGEGRDYPRMIIGKPIVTGPPSACTETYIVVGAYETQVEAENLARYLRTRFLRFLVALRKNTQHVTQDRFLFVPSLPMTEEWTDEKLYGYFGITTEEVDFIEKIVRPMELTGTPDDDA